MAVVEGVMGLFDGYDGASEAGSTAQMAKWLGLPGEEQKGVYHAKDLVYHYNKLPPYSTREYQVRGIKTNISFHRWILRHPRFMSGNFNTGFIDEEYRGGTNEEVLPHKEIALASAAIAAVLARSDICPSWCASYG